MLPIFRGFFLYYKMIWSKKKSKNEIHLSIIFSLYKEKILPNICCGVRIRPFTSETSCFMFVPNIILKKEPFVLNNVEFIYYIKVGTSQKAGINHVNTAHIAHIHRYTHTYAMVNLLFTYLYKSSCIWIYIYLYMHATKHRANTL